MAKIKDTVRVRGSGCVTDGRTRAPGEGYLLTLILFLEATTTCDPWVGCHGSIATSLHAVTMPNDDLKGVRYVYDGHTRRIVRCRTRTTHSVCAMSTGRMRRR